MHRAGLWYLKRQLWAVHTCEWPKAAIQMAVEPQPPQNNFGAVQKRLSNSGGFAPLTRPLSLTECGWSAECSAATPCHFCCRPSFRQPSTRVEQRGAWGLLPCPRTEWPILGRWGGDRVWLSPMTVRIFTFQTLLFGGKNQFLYLLIYFFYKLSCILSATYFWGRLEQSTMNYKELH